MRKLALLFLSLFLFACGGENRSNLLYLNGRIEGDQYFVSTKYAGKVVEVFVKEGDSVKKGQPLARLDSKELDAQLKGAEAAYRAALKAVEAKEKLLDYYREKQSALREQLYQLKTVVPLLVKSAKEALKAVKSEVEAAEAALQQARAVYDKAKRDYLRFKNLYAKRVISKSRFEEVELKFKSAEAGLKEAEANLKALKAKEATYKNRVLTAESRRREILSLERQVAALEGTIRATESEVKALKEKAKEAEAAVERLKAVIADLTVRSPINGTVTEKLVNRGEVVAPGQNLFLLYNLNRLYFEGYVPEREVGLVHLGQKGFLKVDSFPRKKFPVEVSFVSDRAEFTPKDVQTKEERVKEVFKVKARLIENPEHLLKPGMPADCYLYLR